MLGSCSVVLFEGDSQHVWLTDWLRVHLETCDWVCLQGSVHESLDALSSLDYIIYLRSNENFSL